MTQTKQLMQGIWTPWAEVLCATCHGKVEWNGQTIERPTTLRTRKEDEAQGFCTKCGRAIWVDSEIAMLTRIRAKVGGAMEQTGGMCAALTIPREDGGCVVVTALDGPIDIGHYGERDWTDSECIRQASCPLELKFANIISGIKLFLNSPETEAIEENLRINGWQPYQPKYVAGIPMPSGGLLCGRCYTQERNSIPGGDLMVERIARKHEGLGACTRCNRFVWADRDIAVLSRLRLEMGGELKCIGGMDDTLIIPREDGGTVTVRAATLAREPHVEITQWNTAEWQDAENFVTRATCPLDHPFHKVRAGVEILVKASTDEEN